MEVVFLLLDQLYSWGEGVDVVNIIIVLVPVDFAPNVLSRSLVSVSMDVELRLGLIMVTACLHFMYAKHGYVDFGCRIFNAIDTENDVVLGWVVFC